MEYRPFFTLSAVTLGYYTDVCIMKDVVKIFCPECGSVSLGDTMPPFKYSLKGKRLPDFIALYSGGYGLISEKARRIFEDESITGIKFSSDIKCAAWTDSNGRKLDNSVPVYSYIFITGCHIETISADGTDFPRCPSCGLTEDRSVMYLRTGFDTDKWDGNDIFAVGHSIACTEKVKKLAEKHKLKNMEFTPLRGIYKNNIKQKKSK